MKKLPKGIRRCRHCGENFRKGNEQAHAGSDWCRFNAQSKRMHEKGLVTLDGAWVRLAREAGVPMEKGLVRLASVSLPRYQTAAEYGFYVPDWASRFLWLTCGTRPSKITDRTKRVALLRALVADEELQEAFMGAYRLDSHAAVGLVASAATNVNACSKSKHSAHSRRR